MRSSILILSTCFIFTACATTDPVIQTVIQKVEVPVYIPCKADIPQVPDFNFDDLNVDQNIYDKVRALLADRKLHQGYETELLAALKSCTK